MLLLKNGLVFDGSGAEPIQSCVLIERERIVSVAQDPVSRACDVIDCSGLAIAPGFIDLHSHSDIQVLERRREKLKQGVTTEAVGNCGFSTFPCGANRQSLHEFADGILGRGDWGWPSASGYLDQLAAKGADQSVVALVGHGSLRIAVAGLRQGPLSSLELDHVSGLLEEALDSGCAGFSTGLMYAPGSSAATEELAHLCRIVARKGKLYATHMRSYSSGLVESTLEQLDLAGRTGCRLQISHLQAAGRANWKFQRPALDEIEAARARGIDVEFDIYPYQCGSTVLTQFVPQWALDGGTTALLNRLRDSGTREMILAEISSNSRQWEDVTVSSVASEQNAGVVGKTIVAVADLRGQDPGECALDLLLEESAAVNIVSFNQSEENLRELITHSMCSIITDGFYVRGMAHPRLYGTYPKLLGSLVRDRKWLSLAEAIHKSTAKPAARLNLKDRGLIRPGYLADITIFDPERIASRSTYAEPQADPQGITHVIKSGDVQHEVSAR